MTENGVPNVTITGEFAKSDSLNPVHIADTCACWNIKDRRAAKRLLRASDKVLCQDATAAVAVTAMAFDLAIHGSQIRAEIVRVYLDTQNHKR